MRVSKSFLLLAACLTLLISASVFAKDNGLKQKLNPKVGDAVAQLLHKGIAENEALCAPAKVNYDKQANKIQITILGSRDRVKPDLHYPEENPGARESLNDYWTWVKKQYCRIEKKHGVKLSKEDVTMVYLYNPSALYAYEMIRVEDGEFRIPKRKSFSTLAHDGNSQQASRSSYASLP